MLVTYILSTEVCIRTKEWQGVKEHDRSSAGEEGYAVLCAGCEGIKRNGTRPLRSLCGTCKVRVWIKGREVLVRARRIRSEKLREHYREGYARSHEGKGIEWYGDDNVEHIWEQVKWAMVESAREVCDSVRVGEKTTKS